MFGSNLTAWISFLSFNIGLILIAMCPVTRGNIILQANMDELQELAQSLMPNLAKTLLEYVAEVGENFRSEVVHSSLEEATEKGFKSSNEAAADAPGKNDYQDNENKQTESKPPKTDYKRDIENDYEENERISPLPIVNEYKKAPKKDYQDIEQTSPTPVNNDYDKGLTAMPLNGGDTEKTEANKVDDTYGVDEDDEDDEDEGNKEDKTEESVVYNNYEYEMVDVYPEIARTKTTDTQQILLEDTDNKKVSFDDIVERVKERLLEEFSKASPVVKSLLLPKSEPYALASNISSFKSISDDMSIDEDANVKPVQKNWSEQPGDKATDIVSDSEETTEVAEDNSPGIPIDESGLVLKVYLNKETKEKDSYEDYVIPEKDKEIFEREEDTTTNSAVAKQTDYSLQTSQNYIKKQEHQTTPENIPEYEAKNPQSPDDIPVYTGKNRPSPDDIPVYAGTNRPSQEDKSVYVATNRPADDIPVYSGTNRPSREEIPAYEDKNRPPPVYADRQRPSPEDKSVYAERNRPSNEYKSVYVERNRPSPEDIPVYSGTNRPSHEEIPAYVDSNRPSPDDIPIYADTNRPPLEDIPGGAGTNQPTPEDIQEYEGMNDTAVGRDSFKARTEHIGFDDYVYQDSNETIRDRVAVQEGKPGEYKPHYTITKESPYPINYVYVDGSNDRPVKRKKPVTEIPSRDIFRMSSPNYYALIPTVAVAYNFDEPIPVKDQVRENLSPLGNQPALINNQVKLRSNYGNKG